MGRGTNPAQTFNGDDYFTEFFSAHRDRSQFSRSNLFFGLLRTKNEPALVYLPGETNSMKTAISYRNLRGGNSALNTLKDEESHFCLYSPFASTLPRAIDSPPAGCPRNRTSISLAPLISSPSRKSRCFITRGGYLPGNISHDNRDIFEILIEMWSKIAI